MIGALVSGVVSMLGGWLNHRQEIKKIDRQAQINRRKARAEAAGSLDSATRDNITWEDGYLILLFTLPLLLLFFEPLIGLFWVDARTINKAVMEGFEALKATPVAYQIGVGLIFVYVFGFRRLLHRVLDNWQGWRGGNG